MGKCLARAGLKLTALKSSFFLGIIMMELANQPQQQQNLSLLLAAVALVTAPHFYNLSPWVMVFFTLLLLWRAAVLRHKLKLPGRALLFIATLAGASLVYAAYRRFWGLEAGSALFVMGLGLKLMELKTVRDVYLVIYLAFFVALTQYLFSQTIPMAAYTLSVVVLLVAVMIGCNSGASLSTRARLRLAGLMTLQAMPLMALLFVLFPRIPGPLWQLPEENRSGKSGLSEHFAPGEISRLGLSQDPAFRVDFEGAPPPPAQRYWRGPVFWTTDGRQWRQANPNSSEKPPQVAKADKIVRYVMTLEPHYRRWVFALDLPIGVPPTLTQTSDYQVLAASDVDERQRFQLQAALEHATGPLAEAERKAALALPKPASPRLAELVEGWRRESSEPQRLVGLALRFFREQPFFYTLNPPPLTSQDTTDEFIFESQRGFCEHYAASFVVMMRVAGVPARIVTGYQGGHWNSVGKFLEVKQADAHAWAEVWLPESGWTRVDPTAAVAPERIEQGLDVDNQIDAGEIRFNAGRENLSGQALSLSNLWLKSRQAWDSIDHAWSRWILSYGPENQENLLQWLNLLDRRMLSLILLGALLLLAAIGMWILLPKRGRHTDPVLKLHKLFLKKMALRGLALKTGEGQMDFYHRIKAQAPDLQKEAKFITQLYLRLRYERSPQAQDLKRLQRAVNALNPRRRAPPRPCG
jgi:transglutaminase-like putative cysteine protease